MPARHGRIVLCLASVAALAITTTPGCGGDNTNTSNNNNEDAGTNQNADAAVDGGDPMDGTVDALAVVDGSTTCEATPFTITRLVPKVMLVLDQSASMNSDAVWAPGTTRWEALANAVGSFVTDTDNDSVWFGLDAFPDGSLTYLENCYDTCCADPACMATDYVRCMNLANTCNRSCTVDLPPYVDLAPSSTSALEIIAYVTLGYLPTTFGQSPLLDQISYYTTQGQTDVPEFYAGDGVSYLIVVTDGEDNCSTAEPAIAVAALTGWAQELRDTHAIRTIALGIGPATGPMTDQLNAIAANGGTAFTTFFDIEQAGDLQVAFNAVTDALPHCLFDIDNPNDASPHEQVRIEFDGVEVPFETTCVNGWTWGPTGPQGQPRIEFCGTACDAVKQGTVTAIDPSVECTP